jgi:hypothetical protein
LVNLPQPPVELVPTGEILAHQPSAFAFALARPKESATRPIGIRNTPRRVISSEGIDHGKARPKAEAGSDNRILREAGVE